MKSLITKSNSFWKTISLYSNFSTEHLIFKLYEQRSLFIPPELFEIGEKPVHVTKDPENIKVEIRIVFAAYVPIKRTLESFLTYQGCLKK